MRQIKVSRDIAAPQSAVWAKLADFPNIADWNSGVKVSHSTSDAIEGVGATRHCDLFPVGALEETITEWSPDNKLVIRIDSAAKPPIKSGLVTFDLGSADGATTTDLTYEYVPRFGPIGSLLGPLIDRQLSKGFTGFLADLDTAAQP